MLLGRAGLVHASTGSETAAKVLDLPKSCCCQAKRRPSLSLHRGPWLLPTLPGQSVHKETWESRGTRGPSLGCAGSGTRESQETEAASEQSAGLGEINQVRWKS